MKGGSDNYLYTTVADTGLYITNTQDSASGCRIQLVSDSASPAISDIVGRIDFKGNDDGSNLTAYATIYTRIGDETGGTEDGYFQIYTMEGGSSALKMQITGSSDNYLYTTTASAGLFITCTQDGVNGARLSLYTNSTSPADSDTVSLIDFRGENSAAEETRYGYIKCQTDDVTDGTEDSRIIFGTIYGGAENEAARIRASGAFEVDADSGLAAATVGLYDIDDDVAVMERAVKNNSLDELIDLGIFIPKPRNEDESLNGSGMMLNVQKAQYLSWGGIRQNRGMIDALREEVLELKEQNKMLQEVVEYLKLEGGS